MRAQAIDQLVAIVWAWLPDRCEMPDCSRKGIRGQENVAIINGKRAFVCDYCVDSHSGLASHLISAAPSIQPPAQS